jgi:hypothetical protein
MLLAGELQLSEIWLGYGWKQGHTVLVPFASPNQHLVGCELHILDPEPGALQEPQTRAP